MFKKSFNEKNLILLFISVLLFVHQNLNAQCNNCTTTYTNITLSNTPVSLSGITCFDGVNNFIYADIASIADRSEICIKAGSVLNLNSNNINISETNNFTINVYGTLRFNTNPQLKGKWTINVYNGGSLYFGSLQFTSTSGSFTLNNAGTFVGTKLEITGNNSTGSVQNTGSMTLTDDFKFAGTNFTFENNSSSLLTLKTIEVNNSNLVFDITNYTEMRVTSTLNLTQGTGKFRNLGNMTISQNFNSSPTSIFVNCGTFEGSFNLNNGGRVVNTGTFNSSQIDFKNSSSTIENYGTFNFNGGTINPSGGTIYNQGIFRFNSGNISGDGNLIGPSNNLYRGYFVWSSKAVMNLGTVGPNLNFRNPSGASSKEEMFNTPGTLTWDETGNGITWGNSEPATHPLNDCFDIDGRPVVQIPLSATACTGVDLKTLQPAYANMIYEWWTGTSTSRTTQITSPSITNYTTAGTVYLWAKNPFTKIYSTAGSPVTVTSCLPVVSSFTKNGTEDATVAFSSVDFTNNYSDPKGSSLSKIKIVNLPANGILKLNGVAITAGQEINSADLSKITFTPNANWNGTTTFNWNGSDGNAYAASAAVVTINNSAVNDAPVAVNDAVTTTEDTPVSIYVTSNDTDVDGTINVATVDLDPATAGIQTTFTVTGQGTYTVSTTGIVTFTPVANWNGTATAINYTVKDNSGAVSNTATIKVTVTAVNDAPVAVNDAVTTTEDTPVSIYVTSNDTDVDGTINVATVDLDPATAGIQTTFTVTGQGTYTVSTTGIVTFTPVANWNGTATAINYTVNDNSGAVSNTATLKVTVTAVNDAPVAVNDAVTTTEDTPVSIYVTSNDTDVDGTINVATVDLDPATAGIQTTFTVTGQGTYTVNTSGVVTFTPVINFNGTTTAINYTVNDNSGAVSNTATITVTVSAENDGPLAVNDAVTTTEDTPVSFNVTTNDTDIDGTIDVTTVDLDPTTEGIQTTFTVTGQGTYTVNNSGVVTFTPVINFNGTATAINYTVNDNSGAVSNTATITVTVTAVNDAPVAVNDAVTTTEDTPVSINVTSNDTDVDGTINVATVDLDPATEGIQTSFTVSGQGTYTVNASGVVTFTPVINFNGTTTAINYTVNDNSGAVSNTATITVTVSAENDGPLAVNDAVTTTEDTPVSFNVTTNDTDIDGTIDVTTVDLNPATEGIQTSFTVNKQGTYTVNASGVVTFTPVANWNGTATAINYTVKDNSGAVSNTATITVTVTAVNDAPKVYDIVKSGQQDMPVLFTASDFTNNFIDIDKDVLVKIKVESLPANGTLNLNGIAITAGQEIAAADMDKITFNPNANWNGTTTFNWNGFDGTVYASNPKPVTITIIPVNNGPLAINDVNTTFINKSVNGKVLTNDRDRNNENNLVVTAETKATSAAGSVTIKSNGVYTYIPKTGFIGEDTFTYTVCETGSITNPQCKQASVTIEVMPVPTSANDAPVAVDDNYKGINGDIVQGKLLINDFDYDGDSLSIISANYDSNGDGIPDTALTLGTAIPVWGVNTSGQAEQSGTMSLNSIGKFSYTSNTTFTGKVTFNYIVSDINGKTDDATVNIYIVYSYSNNNNNGGNTDLLLLSELDNTDNNSTCAVDDVYAGFINNNITGNLLANDYDAQDYQQTMVTTPVTQPVHGTVVLNADGSFTYTPATGYVGTDQFVYEIYDTENPPARDSATVYFNIARTYITLTLKAMLQGAAVSVTNTSVYTTLMRDDLRSKGLIPISSPYIGLTNSITDSASVLANKNENSIVDWVYIEVRSASKPATVITSTPGLIQRDGDIVDVDGVSPLLIGGLDTIASGTAYITVRHRNHLGVMTALPVDITQSVVYDFTTSALYVQSGIKEDPSFVYNGVKMLWGGDSNSIGQLRYTGTNNGSTPIYTTVLNNSGNILRATSYGVKNYYGNLDLNMNGETKYSAIGNDRNLLYANIIANSKGNTLKATGYTAFYDNLP